MINAGTVAAYLTLDTSDFVKGIASAGQTLTQFRKEQSDGFDGLDAVLGGLGSLILEKVNDVVGAIGSSSAFGLLPEVLRGKGTLAARGLIDGMSGMDDAVGEIGSSMLERWNGTLSALGNAAALGALPAILRSKGESAAQGFMVGIGGLETSLSGFGLTVLGKFGGIVGSIGSSAELAALPGVLQSKGTLAAQGFMVGIGGLEASLGGFGLTVLGKFNGIVGSIGSSAALAVLPGVLQSKGTLAAQGFMVGIGGLEASLGGFGLTVLGRFNGIVGSIGSSAALAVLPGVLQSKGTLAAQGFMVGIGGLEASLGGFRLTVLGRFNGIVGSIGSSAALAALPGVLQSKGTLAMKGLVGGLASQSGAASSSMRTTMNAVKSAAGSVSFVSVGRNIIGGVLSGMNGRKASLMAAASNIAASVSGVMRAALKINSPSRVMMEIGEFTAQGMELGLVRGAGSLYDTASMISRGTAEALSGTASFALAGDELPQAASGSPAYDLYRPTEDSDKLDRLIEAVERLAASQSKVEIDGRPFGRLVREYV